MGIMVTATELSSPSNTFSKENVAQEGEGMMVSLSLHGSELLSDSLIHFYSSSQGAYPSLPPFPPGASHGYPPLTFLCWLLAN